MRDAELLLSQWRDELVSRGHPETLVWLPHQSITFQRCLYYRPVNPPLTQAEVARVIELLDPEELGAFTLLGSGSQTFVTLLVNPFSQDEFFIESQNFYFDFESYVGPMECVKSTLAWFWRKYVVGLLGHRMTDLDYAFSLREARDV